MTGRLGWIIFIAGLLLAIFGPEPAHGHTLHPLPAYLPGESVVAYLEYRDDDGEPKLKSYLGTLTSIERERNGCVSYWMECYDKSTVRSSEAFLMTPERFRRFESAWESEQLMEWKRTHLRNGPPANAKDLPR